MLKFKTFSGAMPPNLDVGEGLYS